MYMTCPLSLIRVDHFQEKWVTPEAEKQSDPTLYTRLIFRRYTQNGY